MNVIFDVDDTLYDQTQPFKRAFAKLWQGKYAVDIDKLYTLSREYSNDIFDQVLAKKLSIDQSGVYRIRKAMKDLNYDIDEEEALQFQLTYRFYQSDIKLSDKMIEILDYCKAKKVRLGVLTNGISEHQHKKINGLHLNQWMNEDDLFVSDDIHYAKPDIKAFEIVENKMHINKWETYFVGDSLTHDIAGAKNAGWHTIWFDRRGNSNKDGITPDHRIHKEEELLILLKQLI